MPPLMYSVRQSCPYQTAKNQFEVTSLEKNSAEIAFFTMRSAPDSREQQSFPIIGENVSFFTSETSNYEGNSLCRHSCDACNARLRVHDHPTLRRKTPANTKDSKPSWELVRHNDRVYRGKGIYRLFRHANNDDGHRAERPDIHWKICIDGSNLGAYEFCRRDKP